MYDDGDGVSPSPHLKRPVRIVVHDKAKHESRTFSCDAILLRSSMSYFASVLDQLLDVADRSANTPLSLNVNCDIPIFSWLIEFIHNRHPPMLPTNVVSLILSSNFLMMHKLYHEGLRYLKDHLVEVLLTDVNMDCISLDTTLGLAQLLREDDVAQALLALVDGGNERCANRSFLSLLLKHVVQQRICDDPVSLRWCDHCGLLVDVETLKAVNGAVTQELPCQMLGAGRVGSRGEVLKTHEATAAVADNFMASLLSNASNATGILVQGGGGGGAGVGGGGSATGTSFAQITGGDSAEAVCWRLIGSCRIYRCDRCDAAVQLIGIRQHICGSGGVSGATSPPTAAAQQPFSCSWQQCLPSARQSQEEHLLNLFATVLPSMAPIRRALPTPNATALSAVASQQIMAIASPYACSFLGDDPSASSATPASLSASLAAQGPILWKRGATHTTQAMQSD